LDCDDNDICTVELCDTGRCIYELITCNDNNPCIESSVCDPLLGCDVTFKSNCYSY
jgi:hypothetical protein